MQLHKVGSFGILILVADVAIVFVGLSMKGSPNSDLITPFSEISIEKESLDRIDLRLPEIQRDLLKALKIRQSTPFVVVLMNGGPIALDWEKDNLHTMVEVSFVVKFLA